MVAPEAKANTSDPDSRILRDGIAYVQGYNAQAAVAEGQIIVAAELVQETNDRHQLTPMLAKTEETLAAIGHEEEIGVCLADAGYWDTDALEAIVERGQRVIVNPDTSNPRRQRVADPRRSYPRAPRMEGIRLAMHETLASDEGRALYAARRELAEPVFGQTKVTQTRRPLPPPRPRRLPERMAADLRHAQPAQALAPPGPRRVTGRPSPRAERPRRPGIGESLVSRAGAEGRRQKKSWPLPGLRTRFE